MWQDDALVSFRKWLLLECPGGNVMAVVSIGSERISSKLKMT